MTESADVVIVGGGPVGAALGLALEPSGLNVLALEARGEGAQAPPEAAARPLALSYGSRLILERLGVWEALAGVTPIERIHVSQAGGYGRVVLDARAAGLDAYGYVVDYGRLDAALSGAARERMPGYRPRARVTAVHPGAAHALVEYVRDGVECTVEAALAAVADGGASVASARMKTRDYRQSAVTARVRTELPHRHTAYERFTRDGPLALLPMGADMAVVWTMSPERAAELAAAPAEAFLQALQAQFGERLGLFRDVRGRTVHPLALRFAAEATLQHTILIGNAAQSLHPVAGQGFNLGLRDAWELATEIADCEPEWLGQAAMLAAAGRRRRLDRRAAVTFTDLLVRVFSNDLPPLRMARGAALAVLDSVPPLKAFLARRMTFGARG